MDRQTIEAALDAGQLYVKMNNGNAWQARRNGKTQTWKRDPDRFRIPIKYGFRGTGQITPADLLNADHYFQIGKPAIFRR